MNGFLVSAFVGASIGLWTSSALAGDIYRCAAATGVAYQDAPCTSSQDSTRIAASRIATVGAADRPFDGAQLERRTEFLGIPPCGARTAGRTRTLWRRTSLCIGMTDDEVLNLGGWGRPTKIVRTRAQREWREDWTYETAFAAPRALHFVNGALAVVDMGSVAESASTQPPALVTVSSAAPTSLPDAAPARVVGSFAAAQTP